MTTVAFTLTSCILGYHVYKDVWDPPVGEVVVCQHEDTYPRDPYAVALRNDNVTVGHVPHVISCICTLFSRRGGIIKNTVTGPRKHSDDLPQGGLELPCTYQFIGPENIAKRLVSCYLMNRMESVSCARYVHSCTFISSLINLFV